VSHRSAPREQALAHARAALCAGDIQTAIRFFQSAAESPAATNADLLELADALWADFRFEEALRAIQNAADREPANPAPLVLAAKRAFSIGRFEESARLLGAALERRPTDSTTRRMLAEVLDRQGRRAEAESTWTAMAEQGSDPEVLADIVLGCADTQAQCAKVLARVGQLTEAGDGRRYQRLNFALGSYYLRNNDYARAISYMEAGRDKSNKNKIEANDPEMLAGLAEAYYRTKKFSEGLEIFFEMSKEFPVVRQIQEAMQGVYSMEQRSAGDVKIL